VCRRTVLKDKGLTCDQTIEFTTNQHSKEMSHPATSYRLSRSANWQALCLLTNNFKLAARTIVDIYKARWQVELFFKWIKQNLKIKSFIGKAKMQS
jgi:putative transposase